jgi:translation initiation factor 3 subunit K
MVAAGSGAAHAMVNPLQANAHRLLETDRYSKAILPELSKCVHSQVEDGWFDREINLAVLKLYQFNPEQGVVELDVLVKVLALALMQVPEPDFKLCLFLVPEQYQSLDGVQSLARLAEKLEGCRFGEFWALLEKKPEVLAVVPGLEASLRRAIFETVALTYSEIPTKVLCDFLHCSQERALEEFPQLQLAGDKIVLPATASNQARSKQTAAQADAHLPQLAQVLSNSLF